MESVVALVVQPGVDMGNTQVFAFDKAKAAALSAAVRDIPGVIYEAHSTDFQSEGALKDLVATHFAILKVGPNLTFAYREAVFAMSEIERRLLPAGRAEVVAALEAAMDASPAHWRPYIEAGTRERLLRLYGLSDRVRYYWPERNVGLAVERLAANVDRLDPPPGLVSQFAGVMPERGEGPLSRRLIEAKVGAVVARYRRAAGEK
jgi:D-tagatose-1,6-bisphosphate aldolase subunit GatZ/KbaZ